MPLYGIVHRLRPVREGSPQCQIVFLTIDDAWSPRRDDARVMEWDLAQQHASLCKGTPEIVSATERARLLLDYQPALPGLVHHAWS